MEQQIQEVNKISYKTLLHEKQYMKFLIAKLISRFGDSIDMIAYSWMVYELTGSKVLIASLFAINGLPSIIFGMISGVVAGYFPKKAIVFLCDVGRGVVVLITAILFITKLLRPWHLYIFTFLNSTLEAFRTPAATSVYSLLLDKDKFDHGIALDSTLSTITEMVGLTIAAMLIALIGTGGVIVIDSITFFLCGVIIFTLKYSNDFIKKEPLTLKNYFSDLKEGFKYLVNDKLILNICLFGAMLNMLFVPFNSMQAVYAKEVIKKGPETITVMAICFLTAIILGGLCVPKIKEKVPSYKLFIISGTVIGLSYLSFSQLDKLNGSYLVFLPLGFTSFIMGLSVPFLNVPIQSAFFTKIDREFIPRVAAVFNSIALCATPFGAIIVASLCKFLSLQQVYLFFSILVIILFLSQMFNKVLKKL